MAEYCTRGIVGERKKNLIRNVDRVVALSDRRALLCLCGSPCSTPTDLGRNLSSFFPSHVVDSHSLRCNAIATPLSNHLFISPSSLVSEPLCCGHSQPHSPSLSTDSRPFCLLGAWRGRQRDCPGFLAPWGLGRPSEPPITASPVPGSVLEAWALFLAGRAVQVARYSGLHNPMTTERKISQDRSLVI